MALLDSLGGASTFLSSITDQGLDQGLAGASKFLSSIAAQGGNDELLRALPGTAMGGVALAFIGMILEFITLSGFHPSVSLYRMRLG